jgi:tRNA(Ile)-lysidine synthase
MRDAEAATPLHDSELDALFSSVADAELIALAVSGGADSLALMLAAARWSQLRGGRPRIVVLSVDHRLRRGSAREAATVVAAARSLGLDAMVLRRKGAAPVADIEAAARRARYRLLFEAARAAGASHVLTAHHRDDVVETFLLRLQRGAGLFGLAAMRPSIAVGDVVLHRPFLDMPRGRLVATTAAAGLPPVADPMNADPRFARARIRQLMPLLARKGLDPAELAVSARRFADAADAVDAAATDFFTESVRVDHLAVAWLDAARFRSAPEEVRARVLVRLLLAIGGGDYPPRGERLLSLLGAIEKHRRGRFKRTLAGTVIEACGGQFAFYRETGRDGLESIALRPGSTIVWDHRFVVGLARRPGSGLTVAASGLDAGQAVGRTAVPGLWRRGRLLAAPSAGYFTKEAKDLAVTVRPILAERLARPPLFPDFGAAASP